VGCRGYVQRMLERVAPGDPTDEEAMSRYFLRALAAGGTVRGGLAFSEALPQCGLDFSIESLGRLDALLAQIRAQLQPDYAGFVNQPDGQNFLRCVGYYTGTAIARSCGLSLRWLAYEPLKAQFPELPRQLETAFGCVIDDRIYFPLGIATEMLFDPEPRRSLLGLASQIQQKVAAPG
jgi:hypothetical protein